MSIPYFLAGFLALFMSVGHSFFGSVFFFRGVEHPATFLGDQDVTWRFVHGGWHFLAVPLFMSALGLFALAFTDYFADPLSAAKVIFWYYVGKSLILLYYQIPRPIMFVRAPLWIGIIGIPLLILWATQGQVI